MVAAVCWVWLGYRCGIVHTALHDLWKRREDLSRSAGLESGSWDRSEDRLRPLDSECGQGAGGEGALSRCSQRVAHEGRAERSSHGGGYIAGEGEERRGRVVQRRCRWSCRLPGPRPRLLDKVQLGHWLLDEDHVFEAAKARLAGFIGSSRENIPSASYIAIYPPFRPPLQHIPGHGFPTARDEPEPGPARPAGHPQCQAEDADGPHPKPGDSC